ncbi:hypothetical protein D3C72_2448860 [compost metagenome]
MSGALTRKATRQEKASVSEPASTGPPKAAIAQTLASAPNTFGTRAGGNISGINA